MGDARLLVLRGARVDKLWHAAALGLLARVEELTGLQAVVTWLRERGARSVSP
jgi:uncharacterized protein